MGSNSPGSTSVTLQLIEKDTLMHSAAIKSAIAVARAGPIPGGPMKLSSTRTIGVPGNLPTKSAISETVSIGVLARHHRPPEPP